MSKKTNLLLSFLFVFGLNWAGAEETNIKISGDRTAVLHVTDTESADADVSGTMQGSVDLKGGKSAINADLKLLNAAELKDAKAGVFTQMTAKSIEAIGFIDAKVPPEGDAPKIMTIKGETLTEGDSSAANFDVHVNGAAQGESIPTGSGDVTFEGDFNALNSSGKFALSGGDIKSADMPFQNFSFDLTEVDNKTTISFEIKVPKSSPVAAQLDSLPSMAPMLEGKMKQSGVTVEGLDFPAPTEEGELKVGKGQLTIVDLRGTIRPFLGFPAAQLQSEVGPDVDVQAALENIIEAKFEKLSFQMNVGQDAVDGTFTVNVNNMKKFYEGYTAILPAIQKQSNQELAREMDEFGPFFAAFMELQSEQAVAAIKAAVDSEMKLTGDAKFNLAPKGEDVDFTASGQINTSNYGSYVAKAKELGLPVAESAVGHINLDLKNQTDLVGDMYLYTDGDIVALYKGMMGKAASKAGAPPEVVQALDGLELNKMVAKMDLQGDKLTLTGNSDTSDLSVLTKYFQDMGGPQLDFTVQGANFDFNMPEGQEGKIDVKVFMSEFMPGKSEAEIKEVLGLPGSATITMDAPAADTKLVAVEPTEIAVDGQLATVQSAGQKLLASSPADLAGGTGSSGGGSNNMGLIALGLLLVAGVGGFMMFSGKKS